MEGKQTEIIVKARKIIAEILDVEEKCVLDSTCLEELGADSLDIVEIALGCEKEFNITIADNALDKWSTAEDVYRTLLKELS